MAYVTAPDGSTGEVPDEQLQDAVAQGFKPREPSASELAKAKAGESNVRSGVEGAVRTILPVAGAEIMANIASEISGESPRKELQSQNLRKEENPIASTVGEIGGFVAGPGKLLGGATAGLRATGLLGKAAAGGVEGGLMGLTEALNESTLGNVPLTAENLAARTMGGMLGGGVTDLGMGVIGKGASALMKKAGGVALRDTLNQLSDKVLTSQLATKAQLGKDGLAKNMPDILRYAKDEGIITSTTTADTLVEAVAKKEAALSPSFTAILDTVQTSHPAEAAAAGILDDVAKALKPYEKGLLAPEAAKSFSDIKTVLEMPGVTWRDVHALQTDLRKLLPRNDSTVLVGRKEILDKVQSTLSESVKTRIDDGLKAMGDSGAMSPELQAMGLGSGSAMRQLSKEWYMVMRLEDMATDRVASQASGGLSLKDMVAGGGYGSAALALATGHPLAAAGLAASSYGAKVVRERGGFVLGGALHALSKSDLLEGVAKSFQKNVQGRLSMAPEALGAFRATIEQASSQGAADLLETHMQLANSTQGPEYLAAMGMKPENDLEVEGAGARLSAFEALKRNAAEHEAQMDSAVDGLFGNAPGRKSNVTSAFSSKDFDATMANVRRILQDPESVYRSVPPELHGAAPSTVGATGGVVLQAAKFLDSKAPKSPYVGVPESIAPQWRPNDVDLDRFNRYREAIESPAKALKNMAQGYVSPEQLEAIKAVYPTMYSELQEKINERLMSAKKPLSYQQKLAVMSIIGPSAIGMSQAQQHILQATFQAPGNEDPGGGMKKPDGRQQVDPMKNQATQSQRIEGR